MRTQPTGTIHPNAHPVDGRAARSGRNNLRLTSLQRDLAETQRLLDEARLLKDHPELRAPSDEWVSFDRRLSALVKRRDVLRGEIADEQVRLLQRREARR